MNRNNWKRVNLKDITTKIGSGITPRGGSSVYVDEGVTFIRSQNVYNNYFDKSGLRYLNDKHAAQLSNVKVQEDDIILNITGASVARCSMVPNSILPARVNQHVHIIRGDKEKVNPFFLQKYLVAPMTQKYLLSIAGSGGTRKALTKKMVEGLEIPLPNIRVQTKIASILYAYDRLIENNQRRIDLLEKSAELLYKEWFVQLRFPGHEHTNITDCVPEGWERIKFGELIDVNKGKNITKKKATPGNIPVVAGGLEPSYYHNEPNVDGPVVTVSASGANAGYVNLYHSDIWSSDSSYIKAKDDKTTYFLYLMLKAKQKHIFGMQRGAAQPHVYPKDLNRLEVVVSPENFKSLAEEYINPNFIQIEKLKKLNDNLRKARDLLIPKLMNGDIAV